MTAPTQAVVRVKVARNVFTSPLMPLDEAKDAAETLRKDVVDCGDGWWFVRFAGFDGREVQIRARDVVAIEFVPDLPDRIRPPDVERAARAGSPGVDGVILQVDDATSYLRRVAGIQAQQR